MGEWVIRFDWPDPAAPVSYAGLAGNPPAAGYAPQIETALRFDDRDHAVAFLQNAYGSISRAFGRVVEVS